MIGGLFNKKMSIRRRTNTDTNSFGEIITTEQLMASDRPCARQVGPGNNMRQYIDNKQVGPENWKLVKYFCGMSEDIREGDIISCDSSEQAIVRDVRDAAGRGHHLEVLCEEVTPTGEPDEANG